MIASSYVQSLPTKATTGIIVKEAEKHMKWQLHAATKRHKVAIPRAADILCGTGLEKHHPGNEHFKRFVSHFVDSYAQAPSKGHKMIITKTILDLLIAKGARFLKKTPIHQYWYVADNKVARDKIGHFLRLNLPKDGNTRMPVLSARMSQGAVEQQAIQSIASSSTSSCKEQGTTPSSLLEPTSAPSRMSTTPLASFLGTSDFALPQYLRSDVEINDRISSIWTNTVVACPSADSKGKGDKYSPVLDSNMSNQVVLVGRTAILGSSMCGRDATTTTTAPCSLVSSDDYTNFMFSMTKFDQYSKKPQPTMANSFKENNRKVAPIATSIDATQMLLQDSEQTCDTLGASSLIKNGLDATLEGNTVPSDDFSSICANLQISQLPCSSRGTNVTNTKMNNFKSKKENSESSLLDSEILDLFGAYELVAQLD